MSYDLDELNNLSEEERKVALQILEEFSKQGSSEIYDKLKYEDYNEIPVDIETFLTDDRYLGIAWKDASKKSKIYPFWMEQLKKLFPNNVDTDYNILLETGARGIGKMQDLDSLVLAESGYIRMGDVKIGTKVYGKNGNLYNVTHIFPQGFKDIYEVKLSDGFTVRCGLEHLWTV